MQGLTIGESIRAIRLRKKMTQQELSDESGVGVAKIGRIERGDRPCRLKEVIAVLDALGYDLVIEKRFML